MKKLKEKDKKIRINFNNIEKQHFILKSIFNNLNFFVLVRWNAFLKLKHLTKGSSKISTTYRCLNSSNKKRFNKLTTFSRNTFLKLIRSGHISGMQKSTW
jgi:ribosomal protein S14